MTALLLAAQTIPARLPTLAPALPPAAQNYQPTVVQQSWLAAHAPWATHAFAGIFIAAGLALVFLLAIQTTKQEGLTGTIGGRVESAYRGRLGLEENLKRVTTFVAVVFVLFATILSLTGI